MFEMDESETSFTRWLWNGLKWFTGLSAKYRSDKEKRLGAFLLITQVFWYLLPTGTINYLLHFSQIAFGFALMIHGQYLASQEEAEMLEAFKRVFMVRGKGVSPDEYAEQHGRKEMDMR
jgi:hypothetical protein